MFVAASPTNRLNGATRLIPQSHLWGSDHEFEDSDAVFAEMEPGDALFMLSSCYHGGSENHTKDQVRTVFASTITRGSEYFKLRF